MPADAEPSEQPQKSYEYLKGLKYQTMYADNRIVHESDVNLLPEGATIIKSVFESTYEQVSYIVQHDYEMIIYKDKDGVMRKGYFPKAEEQKTIDRIPGTHASCSLLANLVFNKYHMNTPVYREMVRLLNNKMNVSRNTVYNWFVKGSEYLKKVLRDFLGNNKIAALQYDGFRSSLPRLLPTGRKNSLGFGSHAGVEVSVIYHTFIETCKMCGVSTLEYFKEFFKAVIKRVQFQMYLRNAEREQFRIISKAIMQGRTDYERSAMPLSCAPEVLRRFAEVFAKNMLPMTIGIKK